MKKRFRFLSALLIAVMAWSLCTAAFAAPGDTGGISVYIPNKIARLHLPDMPEYIALYTRTQSIATYGNPDDPADPCPILPVNEPDIELFFSEQPDWAAVIWPEGNEYISVNENGYAKVSSAGHKTQPGVTAGTMLIKDEKGNTKRVWATTTADHIAGEDAPTGDGAFLAGKDGVTVLYNRNGSPVWVEYTIPDDFYKTGIYGAVTTVRYETVTIEGDYYIHDRDDDGNYVYEPTGKRARILVDENGKIPSNYAVFNNTKLEDYAPYDENLKYSYKKDANGNYIYEDVMQKKWINLKGNVLNIPLEKNNSSNVQISDYKRLAYKISEDGKSIEIIGKDEVVKEENKIYVDVIITPMDGYVNLKLYLDGVYFGELNYENSKFVQMAENDHNIITIHSSNASVGKDSFVHWYYTTWYISKVVTEYPYDANYIVGVESDWRNDSGQFLWGYKITYATSDKERYRITYMPNTTTILENLNSNQFSAWDDPTAPSTDLEAFFEAMGTDDASDFHGMYLHHYEEDTPIYGEYTDGSLNLVSGSGDYLPYWYQEGHGARVYKRLYPCTYFKSPRYK